MRVHYRAPLNFTWEGMEEARVALGRIDDWVRAIARASAKEGETSNIEHRTSNIEPGKFEEALDDDLKYFCRPSVFVRNDPRNESRARSWHAHGPTRRTHGSIGGNVSIAFPASPEGDKMPGRGHNLAEARVQARLAKDWRKSDELRDELAARGWEARDTKDGQKITRRSHA